MTIINLEGARATHALLLLLCAEREARNAPLVRQGGLGEKTIEAAQRLAFLVLVTTLTAMKEQGKTVDDLNDEQIVGLATHFYMTNVDPASPSLLLPYKQCPEVMLLEGVVYSLVQLYEPTPGKELWNPYLSLTRELPVESDSLIADFKQFSTDVRERYLKIENASPNNN